MFESVCNQLHRARWIALDGAAADALPHRAVCVHFRLSFHLDRDRLVNLAVSAADRYRLYVNGQPLHSGPAKGDRWNHFYDRLQVPLLAGENVLLARVVCFAPLERTIDQDRVNGPTSVMSFVQEPLFLLECAEEDPNLSTGQAPWQVMVDQAFTLVPARAAWQSGGAERYDGALATPDWSTGDQGSWSAAQTRFASDINPYGEISPLIVKQRPIPSLYERPLAVDHIQPARNREEPLVFSGGVATVPAGHRQVAELAFDALYTAFVKLHTLSGRGRIRLIYAESYVNDQGEKGVRDDASGHLAGTEDIILAAGAALQWDSFWFRTMRFVRLEVDAETDLTLAMPSFIETDYPLPVTTRPTDAPAWVDELYRISVRTLARCMHETYEDCPYYEQLQYTMDTRLEMLFTYAVGGDTRMARRTLWDFHCSQLPDGMLQSRYPSQYPQVIPVFSLHWIFMLEDYYRQTGDGALMRQYRSTMDGVLDYFDRHIGDKHLTEHLGYWDFGDWASQWEGRRGVPFSVDQGPCTMHNLCYAQALQAAARLAPVMGRPALAADYTKRAEDILAAVRQYCWDKDKKFFREGPDSDEYTQHSQVLAVLTGLVSGREATALMERTLEDAALIPCSFPWMYNVIRAMELTGMYEAADRHIWSVYRDMLKDHLTTVPERPYRVRSDCHAWSALLLYELPRKWLGVAPAAPGWQEILIAPVPCGLNRCTGQVHTPHGPVTVSWNTSDGTYRLNFTAPAVPVQVVLPDGRSLRFPRGGSHVIE